MGKPIENELFLTKLQQIYNGTRAWGTVRVQVKRLFEERRQHKKSMKKQRQQDRVEDCKEQGKEFSLIVKAATPKRKICTEVKPNKAFDFEGKVNQVMQQAIFRQVLERQEKEKKDKKKKGGAKKEESKSVPAGKKKAKDVQRISKNRKDRRKELAKQQRKVKLQMLKAEKLAKKEAAPEAPSD